MTKMKKYKVQVGFVDEDLIMHSLGVFEVEANNPKNARRIAMDTHYDTRLDSASCSPWARVVRNK